MLKTICIEIIICNGKQTQAYDTNCKIIDPLSRVYVIFK